MMPGEEYKSMGELASIEVWVIEYHGKENITKGMAKDVDRVRLVPGQGYCRRSQDAKK